MFKSRRTVPVAVSLALAVIALAADSLIDRRTGTSSLRTAMVEGREVVEGEVIVRYKADAGPIGRERAEFHARTLVSQSVGRRGAQRLVSRELSTSQMIAALRANPDVEYVEPNYVIRANAVPNDQWFGNLWGLLNTGQTVDGRNGTPGADINAVPAWDVTTGSRSNIVAILDTGIDVTHPDLAANIFSAPRQFTVTISGAQLTCPAGTRGFNAMLNTCNAVDDNGHGTHVAGIIGAVGNNSIGVTGVSWAANMLPLKVLDSTGTGTTTDAIEAIEFAIGVKNTLGADGNVRVLNLSWGGGVFSQALNDAIQAANTNDMLVVASAGSGGNNNDVTPHYPASSTSPNVISVAAVDNTGELAFYSNYGPSSVDLAAPGDFTYSTLPNGTYDYLGGTSIAAPFVSGTASLMLTACPSNTAALKAALLETVEPVASLNGKTVTGGRLDAGRALAECRPTLTGSISGSTITAVVENAPGHPNDWIGLFCPATNGDSAYTGWKYLNNLQTPPATGLRNASVTFPAPAQSGIECNVRLFGFSPSRKLVTSTNFSTSTTPSLSIGDVSVTEGNSGTTTATFTVTLSPVNTSQAVTVNYATANGSATAGSDYTATSGTLTFPASTATLTVAVPVLGDTTSEPDETFTVTLSGASNAIIGDAQATGTITNDDAAGAPSITVNTPNVLPGGTISFNVNNGPANRTDWVALVPVNSPDTGQIAWKYLNGTNTAPATGIANAALTFTAPQTLGSYDIRLFSNDSYNRIARSSAITVGNGPAITINDVSVAEGNSGTSIATFTVTVSPVNASQTVTVNYATANGSATAGSDYVAATGTLTFPPSTATQSISVTINGDAVNESNETFLVNLSGAVNAGITDTQGTGTITNDDGPVGPTITVNTPSVPPGGTINFTIANGPGNPMDWVALVPVDGADTASVYWTYLNGQKSAPSAGISNATLQFPAPTTLGSYDLRLFSNNSYTRIARSSAITVANAPALSINDVTVAEGNSGTTVATFTVTLSPLNASQTVTVNYATANGTATAGSDYTAATGTLTFAPSTATQTVSVTIAGDTTNESNETFTVNLSGAANAAIGDGSGTGTITNDDGPAGPSITVSTPSVPPGGNITFTVNNGPANPMDWVALVPVNSPDTASVYWTYLNGTKSAPSSGIANATLTFTAPTTLGSYDIRLFTNNTYNRIARSSEIVVANAPALSVSDVSVAEGNSGTTVATFTVTLSPVNASQTVTVNYATADGSATAGTDYVAANGALTFAPSTATQTISVTINGDTTNEANETFVVNLSGAANAAIGDAQGTGTITNDDGPAGPSITINTPNVAPGGSISFTIANGPGNPMDWVSITPVASPDTAPIHWVYLNGSKTAPSTGISNTTLTFTAPASPGSYDIRLFSNNTYTRIARSSAVTVANAPTLTINDVSVNEGNSGTTVATFTVTLSPVNTSQTVTVDYATANGTAVAGGDNAAASGTLTFAPSTATQTISITINGDTTVESNETFVVNLSNAVNAVIGRAQGTGTIVNDDGPAGPAVTVNNASVQPGGVINFTVSGGPGNATDWVGLYQTSGADAGGQIQWKYLNGQNVAPATGMSSATLQFTAPASPGTYNIRFFASNGYTKLATSATITVAP